MKIRNKSGKIIGIGPLTLLPYDTQPLPVEFEHNAVVFGFRDSGIVELFDDEAQAKAEAEKKAKEEAATAEARAKAEEEEKAAEAIAKEAQAKAEAEKKAKAGK